MKFPPVSRARLLLIADWYGFKIKRWWPTWYLKRRVARDLTTYFYHNPQMAQAALDKFCTKTT